MTNRTPWIYESGDRPDKPAAPNSMPEPDLRIPNLPNWPTTDHRFNVPVSDQSPDYIDYGGGRPPYNED